MDEDIIQINVYGAEWCLDCERLTDQLIEEGVSQARQALGEGQVSLPDEVTVIQHDVGDRVDGAPTFKPLEGMIVNKIPKLQIIAGDRKVVFPLECRDMDDQAIINAIHWRVSVLSRLEPGGTMIWANDEPLVDLKTTSHPNIPEMA